MELYDMSCILSPYILPSAFEFRVLKFGEGKKRTSCQAFVESITLLCGSASHVSPPPFQHENDKELNSSNGNASTKKRKANMVKVQKKQRHDFPFPPIVKRKVRRPSSKQWKRNTARFLEGKENPEFLGSAKTKENRQSRKKWMKGLPSSIFDNQTSQTLLQGRNSGRERVVLMFTGFENKSPHPTSVNGTPWVKFRNLKSRLGSFQKSRSYPENSCRHLAKSGFVYIGNDTSDEVMCAFCNARKSDWKEDELKDVQAIHKSLSPKCLMVLSLEGLPSPVLASAGAGGVSSPPILDCGIMDPQRSGDDTAGEQVVDMTDQWRYNVLSSPRRILSRDPPSSAKLTDDISLDNSETLRNQDFSYVDEQQDVSGELSHPEVDSTSLAIGKSISSDDTNVENIQIDVEHIPRNVDLQSLRFEIHPVDKQLEKGTTSTHDCSRVQSIAVSDEHDSSIDGGTPVSEIGQGAKKKTKRSRASGSATHDALRCHVASSTNERHGTLQGDGPNTNTHVSSIKQRDKATDGTVAVPLKSLAHDEIDTHTFVTMVQDQGLVGSSATEHQGPNSVQSSASTPSVTQTETRTASLTQPSAGMSSADVLKSQAGVPEVESVVRLSAINRDIFKLVAKTPKIPAERKNKPEYVASLQELGIFYERVRHPHMALIDDRIRSFETWPTYNTLDTGNAVEAGLYYLGYGDATKCFHCGGQLNRWTVGDDPFIEHIRLFPRCAYHRQRLGQPFVNRVLDLQKRFPGRQVTFKEVQDFLIKHEIPVPFLAEKNVFETLRADPAVKALLEEGLDEQAVLMTAVRLYDNDSPISSIDLYREFYKVSVQGETDIARPAAPETDTRAISELTEKIQEMRNSILCKVCWSRPVKVIFLPCGHLSTCQTCSLVMECCPVCRGTIRASILASMKD